MKDNNNPPVHIDLIRYLDQRFPDKCPRLDEQQREVWSLCGSRAVINQLIQLYETQNKCRLERRGVLDSTKDSSSGGTSNGANDPRSGSPPSDSPNKSWQGSR